MKNHTKIYLKWTQKHKQQEPHELICEMCNKHKVVDIHHIQPRGMGGNPSGDKDQHRELDGFVSSVSQPSGVHRVGEQRSTDTPAQKVDAELTQAQIGLPIIIIGVFIWIIYFVFYAN